jgi:hypothetical protein
VLEIEGYQWNIALKTEIRLLVRPFSFFLPSGCWRTTEGRRGNSDEPGLCSPAVQLPPCTVFQQVESPMWKDQDVCNDIPLGRVCCGMIGKVLQLEWI